MASQSGSAKIPEIRYGVVPNGFREQTPAKPLQEGGCYWIDHPGPDGTYVVFDLQGKGREIEWEEAMSFEGLRDS